MDIGFIGIGRMGSRMAARLLAAGHALTIHDIDAAGCRPLIERGATAGSSPADVAQASEIILTSLPGPAEVDAVMTGPRGVLRGARPKSLVVELSTIGPAQSRALARACAAAGLSYIDAPVSNGVGPAETGDLTIMVGGDAADFQRAVPVLRCLGRDIYHLGPIGSGNVAKLANQIVYLAYVAAFTEVALLGRQAHLDVPTLIDVLRKSVAGAPLMTGWEQRLASGDLEGGFLVRRVLKDLHLGAEACVEHSVAAPVLDSVIRAFAEIGAAGYMEKDMTALYTARGAS
jgi:3-hydroxyisobutyrate dehydrogenase-like beta-hydroxyacid dehydrogenase